MRGVLIAAAGLVVAALAALWLTGGFEALAAWAIEAQRAAQNRLAGVLRALRGGQPGAMATLIGLAFLYGLFHAAGPGHGKLLIGGWSLGRPASTARLLTLSLIASLSQAAVAVVLVLGLATLFGWDRERLRTLADGPLAQAGTVAALAIGLWLVARGGLALARAGGHRHDHHHHHHLDPAALDRAAGLGEQAALIAGVAIRPCSGALVLMALTVAMGIPGAGIAATFVMSLGTFATVAGAGLLASVLRAGAVATLAERPALRLGLPLLELTAGALLALASAAVLLAA